MRRVKNTSSVILHNGSSVARLDKTHLLHLGVTLVEIVEMDE